MYEVTEEQTGGHLTGSCRRNNTDLFGFLCFTALAGVAMLIQPGRDWELSQ